METPSHAELACAEVWGGNGRIHRGVRIPGLNGAIVSEPCLSGRGGDVYYVSACSSGIFSRVYLADVAGHGEQVAELSAWLHRTLGRRINHHDTGRIFRYVNRHVLRRGYRALTTAACFTYDARHGHLNYCYAGHPHILRFRARENRWAPMPLPVPAVQGPRNTAFGVSPDTQYDVGRCTLEPGDRLLLYSDGLTETPNADRVLFGEERLLESLERTPSDECAPLLDALLERLCSHAGKRPFDHDDVTLLAFGVEPFTRGSILRIAIRNRLRRRRLRRQGASPQPA